MRKLEKVAKTLSVPLDTPACTHLRRIRLSLGIKHEDDAIRWALGQVSARLPTTTELKARSHERRNNFPPRPVVKTSTPSARDRDDQVDDFPPPTESLPRGFLIL